MILTEVLVFLRSIKKFAIKRCKEWQSYFHPAKLIKQELIKYYFKYYFWFNSLIFLIVYQQIYGMT